MRRVWTLLLSLCLVAAVGCAGGQDAPPRLADQVRTGADTEDGPGVGVTSFDGTLEFEHLSGVVRGGINRLALVGDGTGEVSFGVDDPIAVTVSDDELASIAQALAAVDLGAIADEASDGAVPDDGELYRFAHDGTQVEVPVTDAPPELQTLADRLTAVIDANEPA